MEIGVPTETLTDNAIEFRGARGTMLARQDGGARGTMNFKVMFRAVDELGGNGIVERNHRTIKVIATRQACSVPEAVHRTATM